MNATREPGLSGPLVAGVDVGGTKTSVVAKDDRDHLLYEHVTPTDRSSLVGPLAGEVGHIVAEPDGAVCACGMQGCLETIAAGPAIGRQDDEAMALGRGTVLAPHSTAAGVFRASSAGDEVAVEIVDRVADHLARAIRSLALALGVRRVVIGGGVRGAAAIARHGIGLPEREGVGGR